MVLRSSMDTKNCWVNGKTYRAKYLESGDVGIFDKTCSMVDPALCTAAYDLSPSSSF